MPCFYGLCQPQRIREFARLVCDVLGHGKNKVAVEMLVETAAQETHCGRYAERTPSGAGRGLYQMDKIAFDDVVKRTRLTHVNEVLSAFGVDIRAIDHTALDFSPLLSTIFCRLFYMLKPEPFPTSVAYRAAYWKHHYNTSLGKGTEVEYVFNAQRYGV